MTQELTELERVKIENFGLRVHIMQTQLQQAVADRKNYIAEIEKAYPGHRWSDQQGQLVEVAAPGPVAVEREEASA